MSPLVISVISFACVFGAALLGVLLRGVLPEEHLSDQSKDVVKLSMGLVATMTALVLGLLVASAKGAYDAKKTETLQMAAKIAYLDQTLANYGPETEPTRMLVRQIVNRMIAKLWPDSHSPLVLGRIRAAFATRGFTIPSRSSRRKTTSNDHSRLRL